MPDRPLVHIVDYGDSGAGKSTFAATMPKPAIVMSWDPFGKEMPYLKRGQVVDVEPDQWGTPIRRVLSPKGKLLFQIEYYLDSEPTEPEAYSRFLKRMVLFQDEYGTWRTLICDSLTFMEIAARKWHQYKLNPIPGAKAGKGGVTTRGEGFDTRKWFAGSTDLLEEMVLGRLGSLPMNVVVCCHIDEEKDEVHGTFVRNPKAPGRMRRSISAGYSECYRVYVTRDEEGNRLHLLQTQSDRLWNAATQIDAPDPCEPEYTALWANYDHR